MRITCYVLLAVFLLHDFSLAQSRQWPPRNEVSLDPDLQVFISDLLDAISRKDEAFLLKSLDDNVMIAFDGEGGIDAFTAMWVPQQDDSPIWPLLSRLIQMGGVFLHDTADETGRYQFVFPYVYNIDLDLEDDPFAIGVITGRNVNLRKEPNTGAPVITQLTYDVITYLYEEDGSAWFGTNEFKEPEWYRIETMDKKYTGWVYWKYVYSPVGFRMFLFKDARGQWKISTLVAGD